ncbi:type III-B CRISPR-associated protein Cas10/Cmr2 [Laspinema olomoucense]|uniref:Type III-B CRISPR-associated protein Cas10/Cmr2 n=1 Tax=Laspinema olomoucense D3b TaxID=2953688 RepID=A0ABT2NCM0_9CYAN|nr:type III-B CRISPR-associated protein Cas10/Cmr2 [Laspinema sp. D3b]MCT7980437.1 type III-B CRISPR-associated protein Cas10/Cmr2 [Laspinema sp. D3b]
MTNIPYWQAKIWGLLHDPALKALHTNAGRGSEGAWRSLACMEGWISPKAKSHKESVYNSNWLKQISLCDLIASASDRAALGRLPGHKAVDYDKNGLEIKHLLSGATQTLKLGEWHDFLLNEKSNRSKWLAEVETILIPDSIRTCPDARQVYWWLWRCYPVALSRALDQTANLSEESTLPLLPADTRIPDASVWSHTTMTSALAGALAGYHCDPDNYPRKRAIQGKDYHQSRPYVGIFSFTPVQELIKASRKMRDFWAGSWLLHYLSAKVAWALAWKYGPDTLVYPCLYAQPLIDCWLLSKYPGFSEWIESPSERQLLTAGFPNVLVMILPDNGAGSTGKGQVKNPVCAAMQQAEQTLQEEWLSLGNQVLADLQNTQKWMPKLNPHTWSDWLKAQWQTYWTALPLGDRLLELHQSPRQPQSYQTWQKVQNQFARPTENLLLEAEAQFVAETYQSSVLEDWRDRRQRSQSYKARQPNLNVGSWWASIFDQTRFALTAVKNSRTWNIPSAFGPRSTISGIGPVVHNGPDWVTEGETAKDWQRSVGLFDGIEELNATEVLKRGLHRILPDLLQQPQTRLQLYYPDLTSGVAGWLRHHPQQQEALAYYQKACQSLSDLPWIKNNFKGEPQSWGIPWIADQHPEWPHPRILNAGWYIEEFEPQAQTAGAVLTKTEQKQQKQEELRKLREAISQWFPSGANPTDWYVLAAGDGDGMSNWLKGEPLQAYKEYIPKALQDQIPDLAVRESLEKFLECQKRMGPASHNALSRALLDFSNQLVPYLTEVRHAGRLIYGGGDDVLAYTNLWEWDSWLWDIRQCFKGGSDPKKEFAHDGDYWRWQREKLPKNLSSRPLFTMGSRASISFGIVLAHHSVPLAIALENLWAAEEGAKDHRSPQGEVKDAVQVRVLYGNGNILKATAKFEVFDKWRSLLDFPKLDGVNLDFPALDSALFEQAAQVWSQHPVPCADAIVPWSIAFCSRREVFKGDDALKAKFQGTLSEFLTGLYQTTETQHQEAEVKNWLKLAAFVLRSRQIKVGGEH